MAKQLGEGDCNCRGGYGNCILQGRCQIKNLVYDCTVSPLEGTVSTLEGTVSTLEESKEYLHCIGLIAR